MRYLIGQTLIPDLPAMKRTAVVFTLLFIVVGLPAPTSEATRAKKKKATSASKKVAIPQPETLNAA